MDVIAYLIIGVAAIAGAIYFGMQRRLVITVTLVILACIVGSLAYWSTGQVTDDDDLSDEQSASPTATVTSVR